MRWQAAAAGVAMPAANSSHGPGGRSTSAAEPPQPTARLLIARGQRRAGPDAAQRRRPLADLRVLGRGRWCSARAARAELRSTVSALLGQDPRQVQGVDVWELR